METYSIEAVLSAKDDGYTSTMKQAQAANERLEDQVNETSKSMTGSVVAGNLAAKAISKAFNAITSSRSFYCKEKDIRKDILFLCNTEP